MKTLLPFAGASWLALTLSACGGGDTAPSPVVAPETNPTADRVRFDAADGDVRFEVGMHEIATRAPASGFSLSWRDCGTAGTRAVQCAELQVPLDYDDPDGERIVIALNRILAPAEFGHRGSVLYNPGGPGGSGKEYARGLAARGNFDVVAPGFDVIGFDPRGVGESSALQCEFIDAYLSGETGDTSAAEAMMAAASEYGLEGMIEDLTWLSEQCRGYWGGLFDHMGSNQVVRDIDRIREALGEEKLNFLGASYGTRLGALYAEQYPERVRAIVLDAPISARASIVEQVQGQFEQLVVNHETFFAECDAGAITCPPDPRSLFDAYLASADGLGIRSQMLALWELGLSYSFGTSYLPYLLQQQALQPTPDWMYGELYLLEDDVSSVIQLNNVNCADNAEPLLSLEQAEARLDDAFERSPLFGAELGPIVTCNGWIVPPDPVAPLAARGAPPLLIVGGTHDARTPLAWARDLSASLENAVLLTSEHWGHTVVGDGSACVDEAVRHYFLDLALPASGTVCPPPAESTQE